MRSGWGFEEAGGEKMRAQELKKEFDFVQMELLDGLEDLSKTELKSLKKKLDEMSQAVDSMLDDLNG